MKFPYQDSSLSPEARTDDLLSRMTLEEKAGQMLQLNGQGNLEELIQKQLVGSLLHINGDRADQAMDLAADNRLGIPLLIGDDCIHGHSFWPGATIFPTQLAQAGSWNEDLIEKAAAATAREVAGTGIHWTFSPVLCLPRDLRWGRVGETFGEDPFLISRLGVAMIRGYQGKGLDDPEAILATAKHYAGYSETQGGRDASEADISRRKLRSYFLPPFEAAVKAGCMSFMTGYQSMEGLPSTANPWLLKSVLRDEWGFEGLLVTDWNTVGSLITDQKIAADHKEAAAIAIRSGNDLIMATPAFREGVLDAVECGMLAESEIDPVVRRILLLKFRMGLFDNPKRPDKTLQACVGCNAHRDLNLELARESIVLLQNRDDFLPLSPEREYTFALIGPNADDAQMHMGDWAGGSGQMQIGDFEHPRECTLTVRDGLERFAPDTWNVRYAPGCGIREVGEDLLEPALEIARASDVIVAVVGDDMPFIGETKSTATLELQGGQIRLLEELRALGKPMVLVLIHSKPQVLPACVHDADAILEAFCPGMMGGRAIAEILSGVVNPSGRLPISVPYHVGQQPVYYSQVRGQHGDRYADLTQSPQFAFGEGLSYTDFRLSELALGSTSEARNGVVSCEVTLTNTGKRDGKCVVQLYVSDVVTSATWVQKELKDFQKADLKAGGETRLRFDLPVNACSMVNAEGVRVVEAGEFEVEVALSSRDPQALRATFIVNETFVL
ncbi:MAG: glycoside hydrolase family 3 N-terminal domain-containing protein [Kiritimatiellia bacterium]